MKIYNFYDTFTGWEDVNISGYRYERLLEVCFQYSSSVSFATYPTTPPLPECLSKYRLPMTEEVYERYRGCIGETNPRCIEIHHYNLVSEQVRDYIRSVTDNIFSWINGWGYNNPEDIAFFRSDGTPFLTTVVHDGLCSLSVRDSESVSDIIRGGGWCDQDNQPLPFDQPLLLPISYEELGESACELIKSEVGDDFQAFLCGVLPNRILLYVIHPNYSKQLLGVSFSLFLLLDYDRKPLQDRKTMFVAKAETDIMEFIKNILTFGY